MPAAGVLVVIPTYDEADNVVEVVGRTRDALPQAHLLIVDDASPDGTGVIADGIAERDAQVHVLHRTAKSGLGAAYRAGFRWGLDQGFEHFCEMDADLSHDPAVLPSLVHALGGADLVIGSRYVPGGDVVEWPPHRRALSRGGNRYVQLMTGLQVADATSGFRAFRRVVLEELDLTSVHSEGYCFQIDMALRSWRGGFRVVEIPITFTERQHGASKISRRIVLEAVWRTAQWGLGRSRRPPAPHERSVAAG
jgi:dolichol-phosphate mannosyltransferase